MSATETVRLQPECDGAHSLHRLVRCAACKWWDVEIPKGRSSHRPCNNPKLRNNGLPPYDETAGVDDGYGAIETGPEFGCVHGETESTPKAKLCDHDDQRARNSTPANR